MRRLAGRSGNVYLVRPTDAPIGAGHRAGGEPLTTPANQLPAWMFVDSFLAFYDGPHPQSPPANTRVYIHWEEATVSNGRSDGWSVVLGLIVILGVGYGAWRAVIAGGLDQRYTETTARQAP